MPVRRPPRSTTVSGVWYTIFDVADNLFQTENMIEKCIKKGNANMSHSGFF